MRKCCSNCAYGEMHEYLYTFYCRNKDCFYSTLDDIQEKSDCEHWESKHDFRCKGCDECLLGEYNSANNSYKCNSKQLNNPVHGKYTPKLEWCPYCLPKDKKSVVEGEKTNTFSSPELDSPITLYSVFFKVANGSNEGYREHLVNATSAEHALAISKEYFKMEAKPNESMVGEPIVRHLTQEGVINSAQVGVF